MRGKKSFKECDSDDEYRAQFPCVVGFNVDRKGDSRIKSILVHVEYLDGSTNPQIPVKFKMMGETAVIKKVKDDEKQWDRVRECVEVAVERVTDIPDVNDVENPW